MKGSPTGRAGAVGRLRGDFISKFLSVTLSRATSPKVEGFVFVNGMTLPYGLPLFLCGVVDEESPSMHNVRSSPVGTGILNGPFPTEFRRTTPLRTHSLGSF